jgi:hypothetical protein
VAASQTHALLRAGDSMSTALTGGFHRTFFVLGAIALLAPPLIFAIVRRTGPSPAVAHNEARETQRAVAATN